MSGGGRVPLARDGTFAALTPGGGITGRRGASPAGLFRRDTRHLSRWRLTVDGAEPAVLAPARDGRLPAAAVLTPPGGRDEPAPYTAFREQAVASGVLVERLRLVSNRPEPVTARLELLADADFADLFELRSNGRTYPRPPDTAREARELADGAEFTYRRGAQWCSRTAGQVRSSSKGGDGGARGGPGEGGRRPGRRWRGERHGCRRGGRRGRGHHRRIPGTGASEDVRAASAERAAAVAAGTARRPAWTLMLPPHGAAELALRVEARPHGAPNVADDATPAQAAAELRAGIEAFTHPPVGAGPDTGAQNPGPPTARTPGARAPGAGAPERDRPAGHPATAPPRRTPTPRPAPPQRRPRTPPSGPRLLFSPPPNGPRSRGRARRGSPTSRCCGCPAPGPVRRR